MSHLLISSIFLIFYSLSNGDDSMSRNLYTKIGRNSIYTKSDDVSVVSCSSPLNCWLDSLYFYLPETCFNYEGVKGCFSRLTCRSVAASQIASGVEKYHSLTVQLFGGEAQCKGKWEYGYIGGEITAHIKRTDVSILLKSFEVDIYPAAVNFTSCEVPNITIDLKFRGGLVGILLQAISNIIERILENDVKTLICKDFAEYVAKNVSGYLLHDVNPYLRKFTHILPSPASNNVDSPASSHQFINWNKIPFHYANKLFIMLLGDQERQDIIKLLAQQFSAVDNKGDGLFLDLHNSTYTYTLTKHGLQTTSLTTTSTTASNSLVSQLLNHPTLISYSQGNDNELGNLTLILHSIRLTGLESLTMTDQLLLPHPHLNHTLQSSMNFQDINITLLLTVRILPSQSSVHGETLLENTEIFIQLTNITINTIIDLLVNKKNINNLYMDQFQHLDCLLSSIHTINITSLAIQSTIKKMKVIVFDNNGNIETNNLESNVDELLSNVLTSIIINYQSLLQQVIHGVIDGPVKSHINTILTKKLSTIHNNPSLCPSHHHFYHNHTNYIVWKKWTFFQSFLDYLINPITINRYILQRTHQSGQIDISLPNEWTFKAFGLNSILNFSLIHPAAVAALAIADNHTRNNNDKKYSLASDIVVGKLPTHNFPTSHYYNNTILSIHINGMFRNYPIQLSVLSSYASYHTEWEVKYDINKILDFQLHDGLHLSCILSALDTIKIQQLLVTFKGLRVVFDGIVITDVSNILNQFLSYLASDKFLAIINTELLSLVAASQLLCASPSNDISNTTTTPSTPATPSSSSSSSSSPHTVTMDDVLVATGFALCLLVLGIISIWFPRRKLGEDQEEEDLNIEEKEKEKGKTSSHSSSSVSASSSSSIQSLHHHHNNDYYYLSPSPHVLPVTQPSSPVDECINYPMTSSDMTGQQPPNPPQKFLNNNNSTRTASALLFRTDLPVLIRYGLVLLVLLNISLFLWSNISDAAIVMLHTYMGENTEYHPTQPVFTFSLSGTVVDMWHAKVYPLAILIAFFSGIWPYVKLIMMLVAWLAPESLLTSARREQWLISLDFLGKWSLIDIFVLVLMIVAFHVKLSFSTDLTVIVNVVPIFGFHLFLVATMISLLLGHSMLACHRCVSISQWITGTGVITCTNTKKMEKSNGSGRSNKMSRIRAKESLCSYQYSISKRKGLIIVSLSNMGCMLILLLCSLMAGLLLGAAAFTSFAFRFEGLVGWWLGKDEARHDYSLLEVAYDLPIASGTPQDMIIRIIQAVFLAFGFLIPLLSLVTITLLWVLPVTLVGQRRLLVVAEILNAWSALDVFAVSVAAAILQVQQFASFIIGDSCDLINQWMLLLLTHSHFNMEGLEGKKCFDVTAVLTPYSWCLFTAAFLFAVVGPLTLRYTRFVLRDRSLNYVSAMNSLSVDEMELEGNNDRECRSTSASTTGSGDSPPSLVQTLPQQSQQQYRSFFPVHSFHPSVSSSCSTGSGGGSEDVDTMVIKLLGTDSCQIPITSRTSTRHTSSTLFGTASCESLCQGRNSRRRSSSLVSTEVVDILLWLGLLQQQHQSVVME